jgi:hypothetical protein
VKLPRALAIAALGLLAAMSIASPAFADAAAPTDYRSTVVSIEPPTPTVTADIVGGDSFFELGVASGTEVFVIGYQGEQMIWFQPDGTVWENENSPSTYLNRRRLAGVTIPPNATADATPDWKQVASGGHFAWHDHRSHWMQTARPFGLGPGDQILESVIPLVVDDTPVDITVTSTWEAAPSLLPAIAGGLVGIGLAVAAWFLRRSNRGLIAAVPAAVLALVVGAWQYLSLPSVTGPRLVWWVLPMVATLSVAVGAAAAKRSGRFVADGAMLVIGVELAIWGFVKRAGLTAAIIPTDAPGWLDRFTTAMASTSGVAFTAIALWWLFGPVSDSREPSGSPLRVHP